VNPPEPVPSVPLSHMALQHPSAVRPPEKIMQQEENSSSWWHELNAVVIHICRLKPWRWTWWTAVSELANGDAPGKKLEEREYKLCNV